MWNRSIWIYMKIRRVKQPKRKRERISLREREKKCVWRKMVIKPHWEVLSLIYSESIHKKKHPTQKSKQINISVHGLSPNSSSSLCRVASKDLPNPFSPPIPIVHCSREVFEAISCIGTELLYIGSSMSSCLCSSMCRDPLKYVA